MIAQELLRFGPQVTPQPAWEEAKQDLESS